MICLQCERAGGRGCDAHFVRFSVEQDGKNIWRDFDGVGVDGVTIESNAPTLGGSLEFDDASRVVDQNFKFHGVRSSWLRRASCFRAGGGTGGGGVAAERFSARVVFQLAAAVAGRA